MATQTRQIAQFSDNTGKPVCTIQIEYDDSTSRISGVRCLNNSSSDCFAGVIRDSDKLLYGQTFPPGETYIPVPTAGQNRIDFIDLGRGHWRNVSFTFRFPA
jgi:hypothetical protein